jgi:S-adenosylmethionine:tRNA ribosyltransferase-isomerase
MAFLKTADFSFDLPPELIAAYPAENRTQSRLLVLNRETSTITHARFSDLPTYLATDDLLILNNSKVLPASLTAADGAVSFLLLEETSPQHWVALAKPGKKAQPGARFKFRRKTSPGTFVEAEILKTLEAGGERVLRFSEPFALEDIGEMPIPPYIQKRRAAMPEIPCDDFDRYQTVYAQAAGSVAAPTAGLHFTPELLAPLNHAFVTLHVGLGTFRPVKSEWLRDHVMHEERFEIPPGLEAKALAAKRIIAVGTTATRVLESVSHLKPQRGRTKIFIHPPYRFQRVQGLLTNFHLPQSTLLMLVCAFAGREAVLRAYAEAVKERYRFFSYGDAMLIL